jgi:hypothetical protein
MAMSGQMTEREAHTVRSFCRICTAVCGVLVDVSGDRVVRVRGDRQHPLSHGYTCAEGRALPQMHPQSGSARAPLDASWWPPAANQLAMLGRSRQPPPFDHRPPRAGAISYARP